MTSPLFTKSGLDIGDSRGDVALCPRCHLEGTPGAVCQECASDYESSFGLDIIDAQLDAAGFEVESLDDTLGHDADHSDDSQYCQHGTFIGSPGGPDYLCGACESGLERCRVCGEWSLECELYKQGKPGTRLEPVGDGTYAEVADYDLVWNCPKCLKGEES